MILNIIVLILEVMYYSLFLKYAKNEGKLWKYILSFIIVSIIGLFIKTNYLVSYLILVILIVLALKYIVRLKVKLYDILFIFLMLIFKTIIEAILTISTYYIIKNMFVATLISSFMKIGVILLLRNKLTIWYKLIKKHWNKNNFYIRYIFTILMFLYLIVSCLFLIFNK